MSDFLAIFGDTYLPMSNLVQFPETYLIKDVRFWQRYLPQKPICTIFLFVSKSRWFPSEIFHLSIGEVRCFSDQNSNRIINQDCKEKIGLELRGKGHISRVFSLWFLKNRMSVFWRHAYLPCPIMSDFAWDTYLPKSRTSFMNVPLYETKYKIWASMGPVHELLVTFFLNSI